ncbi:conserved domain protein, putative [Synechococcus sp. PCC 7335]|uniref:homocysteine biosynthesis protein n=1 Tax=Synechococcus sp. (strain ATCC 29403 / PCC 7335) TaxID=91464 RepID=UPI00017ECB2D|nr:homocysteine biosynthesis protein [Synechococcus sp. PCC 7335]EDX84561.1 conserved domain protein, putative [Synechococcus sp. PCC 7335]
MRTIAEINDKIRQGSVTVWTITEAKAKITELGIEQAVKTVDVITTGAFEPMEGSGAMMNLGHSDPPIKIVECHLDGVLAYSGFGAVDLYLGAGQLMTSSRDSIREGEVEERGGGHVIADLIADKPVRLSALGQVTDCYPRASLDTTITRDRLNQFYLFNPRNLYQNFIVAVNGGDRPLATYLGPLQPRLGNAVYANTGALSPLLNLPDLQTIGIGTRILLGGSEGYIAWEGTQHFPLQRRLPNRTPVGPAATVALIGDAKRMDAHWVRGCYFKGYGPSLMLGVGVPIPILNQAVLASCAVKDEDLVVPVIDFSIPRRVRPIFGLVSYAQLKSGRIVLDGKAVRTAPLASVYLSGQVALDLKQRIEAGEFELTKAIAALPTDTRFMPQDSWGPQIDMA